MRPKLTIGMATYDDFHGVYFTIQAIRMFHPVNDVEFIVIDNNPGSPDVHHLRNFLMMAGTGNMGARYIPFRDAVGTAVPRNQVFEQAAGEIVMCIDSHVLPGAGSIARLKQWFDERPGCMDLIQGPLVYDTLNQLSTHFMDIWRKEMWGVWGTAWEWPERIGEPFAVYDQGNKAEFHLVRAGGGLADLGDLRLDYSGHDRELRKRGARALGYDDNDEFEIPAQGLGLFACRKEAWLGFNPLFRGFGGEEWYIHNKYRKAGHRCMCLGFLKWVHRFKRPGGARYPLTKLDKIRNYVIGHQELGLSLERVYEHFVTPGLITQKQWDTLLANPKLPALRGAREAEEPSLERLFEAMQLKENAFDAHLEKMSELSGMCDTVVEVSRYSETTVGLLAGQPKHLYSHVYGGGCSNPLYDQLKTMNGECDYHLHRSDEFQEFEIEDCDFLFYKPPHLCEDLFKHLEKWAPKVKRVIAIHDTERVGQKLENMKPGFQPAMRDFVEEHPEWFVYYHTKQRYGMTVLGRRPEDRPEKPIIAWPPGAGPGTEMTAMLKSIGIVSDDKCACRARANQMDLWGADGCRENRDTIVQWFRDGHEKWGWVDKIKAATAAVVTGLAFRLDPLDPFNTLVDEAIRRSETKEKEYAKSQLPNDDVQPSSAA